MCIEQVQVTRAQGSGSVVLGSPFLPWARGDPVESQKERSPSQHTMMADKITEHFPETSSLLIVIVLFTTLFAKSFNNA